MSCPAICGAVKEKARFGVGPSHQLCALAEPARWTRQRRRTSSARRISAAASPPNTWGYEPIGAPGPYESLNVGLNSTSPVAVGTDVNTDAVYWNTLTPANYTDGGAGGVGIFRLDTGWTPYTPAVQFTTFALPTTTDRCKNGAWQNLVRSDFTSFKNQGACVSYVNTGK
jgi:hypothetical protein